MIAGLGVSCGGSRAKEARPVPPAGRAPVTLGEVVQLRLAVEGFDTVFDAKAEEQDLLPYLVHAWATLYHQTDPQPNTESRYRFTEALCRARLPKLGPSRHLLSCMEKLREALYDDLLAVTQVYRRIERSDRVGEFRLSEIEKDLRHRRGAFLATRRAREERRQSVHLPEVAQCSLEQPIAPVVSLGRTSLHINGARILDEPKGLRELSLVDAELVASQLEGRLLESPRDAGASAQLIVAADRGVDLGVLEPVLARAAHQGVTRVCFKVDRSGSFRVPCCMPLRLGPPGVKPTRYLELGSGGLVAVDGESRTTLPPKGPLGAGAARSLRLARGATVADLARLLERAGGEAALEVLGGASPGRRTGS